VKHLKKLLQSPFSLHKELIARIERECGHARAGRKAHIMAQMNSLVEPQIIQALYLASQHGVQIDLVVRGICCLRPGVPGLSENIRVRSIIGRFLEHPRVYWFLNDGKEEAWLSSADWMDRNFFRRVEVAFPISEPELRERVVQEALRYSLADNTQAWELRSDGSYERVQASGELFTAQAALLKQLAESP
jgi:polyphosphate kinase